MYNENDLIGHLESINSEQVDVFLSLVEDADLMNVLYYFPEDIGEIIYTNLPKTSIGKLYDTIPDMKPPTEDDVLESIDNMIYVLESDEYADRCRIRFLFKAIS